MKRLTLMFLFTALFGEAHFATAAFVVVPLPEELAQYTDYMTYAGQISVNGMHEGHTYVYSDSPDDIMRGAGDGTPGNEIVIVGDSNTNDPDISIRLPDYNPGDDEHKARWNPKKYRIELAGEGWYVVLSARKYRNLLKSKVSS